MHVVCGCLSRGLLIVHTAEGGCRTCEASLPTPPPPSPASMTAPCSLSPGPEEMCQTQPKGRGNCCLAGSGGLERNKNPKPNQSCRCARTRFNDTCSYLNVDLRACLYTHRQCHRGQDPLPSPPTPTAHPYSLSTYMYVPLRIVNAIEVIILSWRALKV